MLAPFTPSERARPWLVVLSITGATVLPTYISGALTVALPTIGSQIGLDSAHLQWPLTLSSLVNGAFLLVSGGLADAFGRKYAFLIGGAWIMIFSIPLAVIKSAPAFIAMSAILGFGYSLLAPAGTGILSENLPDGAFKNASFAALGAGQPLGFILGLISGGIFADKKIAIYVIVAGAAGIFSLLAVISLPHEGERLQVQGSTSPATEANTRASNAVSEENESTTTPPRSTGVLLAFDWIGVGLSTAGIVLLTLGLALASTQKGGWRSPSVLLCLTFSVAIMTNFFLWEAHKQRQYSSHGGRHLSGQGTSHTLKAPLVPPGIWKAPSFSPLLAVVFFAWLSFNALTYFCTLMYQEIQHQSPVQTSIRFLPMVGSGLFLNVAGGYFVSRVNALWLFLMGSVGGAASCLLFTLLDPDWSYARGFLSVMILTVSPDIFFPAAQLFACQTVGSRRAALAGSLFNVTVRLASSIGLALTSSIASSVTNTYKDHVPVQEALLRGYRAAGWVCFGSSLLSASLALAFTRNVGIVGQKRESRTSWDDTSSDAAIPLSEWRSQTPAPSSLVRSRVEKGVHQTNGTLH